MDFEKYKPTYFDLSEKDKDILKRYVSTEWNRRETIDYFKQNPFEYLKECKGTFVDDKAHKNLKYILI